MIFTTVMLCFIAFILGVNTMGYSLMPEKFPLNWYEIVGWLLFASAIIAWTLGRKI